MVDIFPIEHAPTPSVHAATVVAIGLAVFMRLASYRSGMYVVTGAHGKAVIFSAFTVALASCLVTAAIVPELFAGLALMAVFELLY